MACSHTTDDDLRLYALDHLAAAPVEEHLLVCEECLDRVARSDAYVGARREGSVLSAQAYRAM